MLDSENVIMPSEEQIIERLIVWDRTHKFQQTLYPLIALSAGERLLPAAIIVRIISAFHRCSEFESMQTFQLYAKMIDLLNELFIDDESARSRTIALWKAAYFEQPQTFILHSV